MKKPAKKTKSTVQLKDIKPKKDATGAKGGETNNSADSFYGTGVYKTAI